MKHNKITTFVILCFLFLFFGFEANAQVRGKFAANTNKSKRKQQWEYCAVSLTNSVTTADNKAIGQAFITFLNESNKPDVRIEVTDFPSDNNLSKRKALSKAFSQLGNDGWELVGKFPFNYDYGGEEFSYFFKRQKQ